LEFGVYVWDVVLIRIVEEHPDKNTVKHRDCGHLVTSAILSPNAKPGPPPVAAPERSDGAATGGRAEALVGRLVGLAN
jgi:hypothetical protein